jgi:hypothetical protein
MDNALSQDISGMMSKQGRGKHISFWKPWSTRRVVLNIPNKTIDYFDENNIKKGGLLIDSNSTIKILQSASAPKETSFAFEVTTATGSLILAVSSSSFRDCWLKAIDMAVNAPISEIDVDELKRRLIMSGLEKQVSRYEIQKCIIQYCLF